MSFLTSYASFIASSVGLVDSDNEDSGFGNTTTSVQTSEFASTALASGDVAVDSIDSSIQTTVLDSDISTHVNAAPDVVPRESPDYDKRDLERGEQAPPVPDEIKPPEKIWTPSYEDQPDLVIAGSSTQRLEKYGLERSALRVFEEELIRLGLDLQSCNSRVHKNVRFLLVRASWKFLEETAEKLEIKVGIGKNDSLSAQGSSRFLRYLTCSRSLPPNRPFEREDELRIPYKKRFHTHYQDHDNLKNFFTQSEKAEMIHSEIKNLTLTIKQSAGSYENADGPSDSKVISYIWLQNKGLYDSMYVLHDCSSTNKPDSSTDKTDTSSSDPKSLESSKEQSLRKWLSQNWASYRMTGVESPLSEVNEYLGQSQGLYFAWMELYTQMLAFPSFGSIFLFFLGIGFSFWSQFVHDICYNHGKKIIICRECPSLSCEYSRLDKHCESVRFFFIFDNTSTLFYTIFLSIWAVIFLERWKRKEAILASEWSLSEKLASGEAIRADYVMNATAKRPSPITGEPEPYVPWYVKGRQLLVTVVTMLLALGIVVTVTYFVTVFGATVDHLMSKTKWIRAGGATRVALVEVTESCAHLLFIFVSEAIFFPVARKLTVWELHRTDKDFEKHFIFKAVVFQLTNYFGRFVYRAFFQTNDPKPPHMVTNALSKNCGPRGCLDRIMIQVIVVMMMRQLLQNASVLIKPALIKLFRRVKVKPKKRKELPQWEIDYEMPSEEEPSAFNEYMESVIQYAFIMMFSPAFPLCSLFAWINNLFAIRAGALSMLWDYRRSVPESKDDIGAWRDVLTAVTRLSIMANTILLALNSMGLELIFVHQITGTPADESIIQYVYSKYNTSHFVDPASGTAVFNEFQLAAAAGNYTTADYSKALRTWNNETVTECYFKGRFYNPTGKRDGYIRKPLQMHVFLAKLAFIFVLQNFAVIIFEILQAAISRSPSSDEQAKQQRENYLYRQLVLKHEREQAERRYAKQQKRELAKRQQQYSVRKRPVNERLV